MYQSVVAMFATRDDALRARDSLLKAGTDPNSIVVRSADDERASGERSSGEAAEPKKESWVDWLFGSEVPEEHQSAYRAGLTGGHTLVSVKALDSEEEFHRVATILEDSNAINVNEEGKYSGALGGYHPSWDDRNNAAGTTGVATETGSGLGRSHVAETSAMSDAGAASARGTETPTVAAAPEAATLAEPGAARASTDVEETVLPVAKEELRVGVRPVRSAKAYRIRTVVSEVPVEADVRLHDETVTTERRPTTGTTTAGDPFEEKTVEVHTTREEPVVEKVITGQEEMVVRKERTEHVETVHDTVRETHVETEPEHEMAGSKPTDPAPASERHAPGEKIA